MFEIILIARKVLGVRRADWSQVEAGNQGFCCIIACTQCLFYCRSAVCVLLYQLLTAIIVLYHSHIKHNTKKTTERKQARKDLSR